MKKMKLAAVAAMACLLTSVSMLSAAENNEVTCYVRVTGTKEWTPRVELSVNDKAADVIWGTGAEGITAIDALVEACYYAVYSKDPTIADLEEHKNVINLLMGNTAVEDGWMDGIMGDVNTDEMFWLFSDGKKTTVDSVSDHVVTTESDLWFYYTDWTKGYRGYFDKTEYKGNSGEAVEVNLTGVSILNEIYGTYKEEAIAGTITVTGNGKTYIFDCDENGKAKLEKLPDGKYTLTATWEKNEYGYVLVPPIATLQVGEEPTSESQTTVETTDVETTTEVATTKANVQKVTLKKVTNVKGKKAKVTIKKLTGVTGYQIKYSTSKKFKAAKTVKTKKSAYTIKKLKKGKKYYVKVRAYKTVGAKRYYGKWSKVKKVKIKK